MTEASLLGLSEVFEKSARRAYRAVFALEFKHFERTDLKSGQNLSRSGRNVVCKIVIAMRTFLVRNEKFDLLVLAQKVLVADNFARRDTSEYI